MGAALGSIRGGLAMVVYAAVGIIGVPWFSEASHGWGVLPGPTGGYIVGFIFSASFVGWLSERQWDRKFFKAIATFAGGTLVVFAFGLPWLAFSLASASSRPSSSASTRSSSVADQGCARGGSAAAGWWGATS